MLELWTIVQICAGISVIEIQSETFESVAFCQNSLLFLQGALDFLAIQRAFSFADG